MSWRPPTAPWADEEFDDDEFALPGSVLFDPGQRHIPFNYSSNQLVVADRLINNARLLVQEITALATHPMDRERGEKLVNMLLAMEMSHPERREPYLLQGYGHLLEDLRAAFPEVKPPPV